MTKYKLYYFNMRGRAEIIRLIFAAAGQEYEDIRFEHAQWPQLKSKFEFSQVPVLEIDGRQFNQSNAIAHYLAQQFGLAGETPIDAMQCHALNDTIRDMFEPWGNIMWEKDPEKKDKAKKHYVDVTVRQYLLNFEKFCAKHVKASGFLVADRLTYADLVLFHGLSTLKEQLGNFKLEPYPTLKKHLDTIGHLPQIKEYLANRPQTIL